MGALERLIEKHRPAARPLAAATPSKLCIVTCDDAVLTRQLEDRLGLDSGETALVRLPAAGAALPIEVLHRVVAKAVFVGGCEEVLLLGHSGCSLAKVSVDALIGAIERSGVARTAIPFDLRDLVGAGRDPRAGLREVAEALRRTEFLPDALLVHLAELDDATGTVRVLEHGAQHRVSRRKVDEAVRVAGYSAGPMEPSAVAPAVPLPPGALGAATTMQLNVVMPEVTTVLERVTIDAKPIAEAATAPRHVVSAEDLFRDPPTAVVVAAPPPPLSPPRPISGKVALRPDVSAALQKVRAFLASEVGVQERRDVARELQQAAADGASTDELVKLALRPVLQSGSNRYKVIDELLLIKEHAMKLPPARAGALLQQLLP